MGRACRCAQLPRVRGHDRSPKRSDPRAAIGGTQAREPTPHGQACGDRLYHHAVGPPPEALLRAFQPAPAVTPARPSSVARMPPAGSTSPAARIAYMILTVYHLILFSYRQDSQGKYYFQSISSLRRIHGHSVAILSILALMLSWECLEGACFSCSSRIKYFFRASNVDAVIPPGLFQSVSRLRPCSLWREYGIEIVEHRIVLQKLPRKMRA
jgi:hypothetical protein